jgi:hypothetical protein
MPKTERTMARLSTSGTMAERTTFWQGTAQVSDRNGEVFIEIVEI